MLKRVAFPILSWLLASGAATAQPETASDAQKSLTAPANLTFGAVAGSSGPRGSSMQIILDASKKDKIGTAALGWGSGQRQIQLAFSGPLDSNEATTPLSLTGLAPGANAKLSFSRLSWRGPDPRERQEILALCTRAGLDPASADPAKTCDLKNFSSPDDEALFRFLNHLDDWPWMIGGEVTGGRVTQKYLDSKSLASLSQSEMTWNAVGRIGAFSSLGFAIGAFTYSESLLAAGAASQICRPIEGTTGLKCDNSVLGAPHGKTSAVVSVELRRFIASAAAWSPSIQYDLKNDVTAVEVPVYFLGSGTTPMGGIRFGWRSDTEEVSAVVFVGAAFRMIP